MTNQFDHTVRFIALLLAWLLILVGVSLAAGTKQIIKGLRSDLDQSRSDLSKIEDRLSQAPQPAPSSIRDSLDGFKSRAERIRSDIDKLEEKEKAAVLSSSGQETADSIKTKIQALNDDIGGLDSKLALAVGDASRKREDDKSLSGSLTYLAEPLIFWGVAGIIALALILHVVHLLGGVGTRRELGELKTNVRQLALATAPGNGGNLAVAGIAEQIRQQGQSLQQLSGQVQQIDQRLTNNEQDDQDLADAIVRTTRWMGDAELRNTLASNGNEIDDRVRRAIMQVIERNREPLSANAARIEPLRQAFSGFIARLKGRPQLPPELLTRAQHLQSDIELFNNWQRDADSEFSALQLGSAAERQSRLHAEHSKLIAQLEKRQISISDHIEQYRDVLNHYLGASSPNNSTGGPADYEAELGRRISGAADLLMDWFDGFFQLQILSNSLARATPPAFEPEALTELSQVQKVARDVLSKFDVQPEEIHVGRTSYDRRLHEAALIRQSAQVPANTVIGVQRCGFRRVSTGEVLRRPQVVVAGAAAG